MQAQPARLWSIRSQVLVLGAALTLPLLALLAWFIWLEYRSERERQGESLLYLARALSSSVDRELASGRTMLQALATSEILRAGRYKEYHEQMKKAASIKSGSWIELWDASGQMVAHTLRPWGTPLPNIFSLNIPQPGEAELPNGNPWSVREALETGRPAYSNLFVGPVTRRALVAIDVPVWREGKIAHILALSLPTESLHAIIAEQKFQPEAGALILDRRRFAIAMALTGDKYIDSGKRVSAPLSDTMYRNREGWGEAKGGDGNVLLQAFTTSGVSGWVAAVSLNETAAMAPFWRAMMLWAAGLAAVAAVLGFVAWWMSRRVVVPLRALAARARTMGSSAPLELPAVNTRELAELSTALAAADAAMRAREGERLKLLEAEARGREAAEAAAAKDQFLAVLSHELRNPLAAIALNAQTLAKGNDGLRAKRALAAVTRQVEHLRRLVDDLLDLAAVTHDKLTLCQQPLVLLDEARAAAAAARERHPGVVFEARGETVHVHADPVRVQQMIGNLLDNAAKAGARIVRMHASADVSGGTLEVQDDGEGIAPEVLPRLFDAFFQGPRQDPDRPRGGLGLGLTLINRLALLHGGALAAQSEGAGRGSTFKLRLPLAPVTAAVLRRPQRAPIGKLRILVVEDEEDVREGLRAVLETEGHEVAATGDGLEGLALLERIGPDAAFIDIGLPGLDGLELARRARAGGSRALLIAISGYAAQRDRDGTSAAGFDFHLPKPPSAEDLKLLLTAAPRAA